MRGVVSAIHLLQYIIVAGLHREVNMFAHLWRFSHCIDEVIRKVFGMGCGESDSLNAIYIVYFS